MLLEVKEHKGVLITINLNTITCIRSYEESVRINFTNGYVQVTEYEYVNHIFPHLSIHKRF